MLYVMLRKSFTTTQEIKHMFKRDASQKLSTCLDLDCCHLGQQRRLSIQASLSCFERPWQLSVVRALSHFVCSWLQVFQVRKKDTGQIYAMKVMRKEKVLEKEHGSYIRAESEILKTVIHPYIVALRYSFQVRITKATAFHPLRAAAILNCCLLGWQGMETLLAALSTGLRDCCKDVSCLRIKGMTETLLRRQLQSCTWFWISSTAATCSSSCSDRSDPGTVKFLPRARQSIPLSHIYNWQQQQCSELSPGFIHEVISQSRV